MFGSENIVVVDFFNISIISIVLDLFTIKGTLW